MTLYKTNAILTFSTGEVVKCCLKLQTTSTSDVQATGLQNRETRYKGNVTNSGTIPSYLLPPTIKQNARGHVVFNDDQQGEFIMFECLRTRWKEVERMMGQNVTISFFPYKPQRSEEWT